MTCLSFQEEYREIMEALSGAVGIVENVCEISPLKFQKEYYEKNRPLLISGGAKMWPALRKWSPEYLIGVIGKLPATLNLFKHYPDQMKRNILPKMAMAEAIRTIDDNVNPDETYYIIRDSIINHSSKLLEDIRKPQWINDVIFSTDLWYGSARNVTPIHYDAVDNFIVQIKGQKTVIMYAHNDTKFIYPQSLYTGGRFNFSEISSRKFLKDDQQYARFHKATAYMVPLEPGDVLYIPPGWWHEVHTHNEQATTITFFFNKRKFSSFIWQFLGYQSCRLHEIEEDKETKDLLYFSNYTTAFNIIPKLLEKKQYWLAAVLGGVVIENLVRVSLDDHLMGLFDILEKSSHASHPVCKELISHQKWPYWYNILKLGKQENNEELSKLSLENFAKEIEAYIHLKIPNRDIENNWLTY
jgi:hypothetical protein